MSTTTTIGWLGVLTLLLGLAALFVRDRDQRRRGRNGGTPEAAARWPWAARALLVAAVLVLGLNTWVAFG